MKLSALGIVTKEVEISIQFYNILGVEFKAFGEDKEHYEGESSGVRIMLDTFELMRKINPKFEMPEGSKLSLCFELKNSIELDHKFKEIIGHGFKSLKTPWDAFWGQRYAIVLDPSGNQVDLFCNIS